MSRSGGVWFEASSGKNLARQGMVVYTWNPNFVGDIGRSKAGPQQKL
jgi:hypothetical protein